MGAAVSAAQQHSAAVLAALLEPLGSADRAHDAEIIRLLTELRSATEAAGVGDFARFLATVARSVGAPAADDAPPPKDLAKTMRLAEVDALEATISQQLSTERRYRAQLVEVEATLKAEPVHLGFNQEWMGERTIQSRARDLEDGIAQAEAARKTAEAALTALTPQVTADLVPELVRTRAKYRDVYAAMDQAKLAAMDEVLSQERYRDGWAPQTLTEEAKAATNATDDAKERTFFLGMQHDARRALPVFRDALADIAAVVNAELGRPGAVSVLVAPLKEAPRALAKVFRPGRDFGNYAQVTDLVRGTLACDAADAAARCAEELAVSAEKEGGALTLVFAENRLRPDFDAVSGYRDALTLVTVRGHICEVQLNLKSFLEIKEAGGGHAVYEAARKVAAFDRRVNTYIGQYSEETMQRVERGMVTDLTLVLKRVEAARFAAATGSATCQLARLLLVKIDGGVGSLPELFGGTSLAETLQEVEISCCGYTDDRFPLERLPHLRVLKILGCKVGAECAKAIGAALEKIVALQTLNLRSNFIGAEGGRAMSASLEKNATLQTLDMGWNNDIGGANESKLRELMEARGGKFEYEIESDDEELYY